MGLAKKPENLLTTWFSRAQETARLMVGIPDYDAYVAHMQTKHPDQQALSYEAFLSQLRHPVNEMPPYVESAMPDAEVANIHAYVSSLPPPPDVKSIPILNR